MNSAFSYQTKVSTETFLGPYVGPGDLAPSRAAEHADGSFGKTIADFSLVGQYPLTRFIFCGVSCKV